MKVSQKKTATKYKILSFMFNHGITSKDVNDITYEFFVNDKF